MSTEKFQVQVNFKPFPLSFASPLKRFILENSDFVECPMCESTWFFIENPDDPLSPVICNECLTSIDSEGIIHFVMNRVIA